MATAPSEVMGATAVQDEAAEFERLYQEHVADVYRYALAVLRNPADAEDVTQATFLNAWRAFRRGEYPHSPQNWFLSIAHNVCRVRFRSLARRPREVELEPELIPGAEVDAPKAEEILDALAQLPLNQRAAIVMRELEGRSYGEIAQILGVTKPAVETLLFRARRSLRNAPSLRSLAAIPLPASLGSFFRNGGAVEAGAAAVLGTGVVAKTVAVVAASLAVAGAAQEIVKAEPKQRGPVVADVKRDVDPVVATRARDAAPARLAAKPKARKAPRAVRLHSQPRGGADARGAETAAAGVAAVAENATTAGHADVRGAQPRPTHEQAVETVASALPKAPVKVPAAPVQVPEVPPVPVTPPAVETPKVELPQVPQPPPPPPLP